MFKNYVKVALRTLRKNKAYATINIVGLALGLMVSIVVFLYVKDETSYEKHLKDYDRIYRFGLKANMMGMSLDAPISCNPMANSLRSEFPEVEIASRLRPMEEEVLMILDSQKGIYIDQGSHVDSAFFSLFSYEFMYGNPSTALKEENAIVLTEETAHRLFGTGNPMGKIIRMDDKDDFVVRAVVKEPKGKSHFQFNFFIAENELTNIWISNNYYTYVKLQADVDPDAFLEKASDRFLAYVKPNVEQYLQVPMEEFLSGGNSLVYDLHEIDSIHLYSQRDFELQQNGNITYLYVFIAIAFLVLLIAGINFMNLSTARSFKRAKEVGIRKVSGASRTMLISQFMVESVMQSLLALFLAFILVEFILPVFNQLMNTHLQLSGVGFISTLGFALFVSLLYGLFSGSYPALFLSRFKAAKILKGDLSKTKEGSFFRKSLVVVQFAASIMLIIGIGVIFLQISYMQTKSLGFDGEQVLVIPIQGDKMLENFEDYRAEFEKIPQVISVARSSYLPGQTPDQTMCVLEGSKDQLPLWNLEVDYNFFETLGIEIIEGESFRKELNNDSVLTFILNETALNTYNITDPINQRMSYSGDNEYFKIVGVVKDFHIEGLDQSIKPMVFSVRNNLAWASIKILPDRMQETVAAIEQSWNKLAPAHPFRYSFLDASFGEQYHEQESFGAMFLYLTILAIIISCMGLYGLAAFTAEQRTKEIGIRKVLGASIPQLMQLLSFDFLKLVFLANFLAWPTALVLARNWLSGFSYQIDMPWLPFVFAALAALLVALITVSHQAYLAAVSDPIKALRYE